MRRATLDHAHSLKELVRECSKIEASAASLSTDARFLDMFYIPTRYPNGLGGDLSPVEEMKASGNPFITEVLRTALRLV